GLTSHVEARVHQHGTTGSLVKRLEEAIKSGISLPVHRLNPGAVVHMSDGWNGGADHVYTTAQVRIFGHDFPLFPDYRHAPLGCHWSYQQHVRALISCGYIKPTTGLFLQDGRG